MKLQEYFSIGSAIVKLMGPLVEVVIHSLHTKRIVFIEGSLSRRGVGDPSLLDEDINITQEVVASEPYTKLNFDGRLLHSISIPIKENDIPVALMCINYDVSVFQQLNNVTNRFLKKQIAKKPELLFKNDWQDRIHQCIHTILEEKRLTFNALTNKNKKEIVHRLYQEGAFSEKNAADYIAKILNMSRATIFNHLRIYRKDLNAS